MFSGSYLNQHQSFIVRPKYVCGGRRGHARESCVCSLGGVKRINLYPLFSLLPFLNSGVAMHNCDWSIFNMCWRVIA
jgi:hypothetical protein